jgi:hypothetical protein
LSLFSGLCFFAAKALAKVPCFIFAVYDNGDTNLIVETPIPKA